MSTDPLLSTPRVLAVVPARGGSKRLPRKNITLVGGKPLIAHTIQACQSAKSITDWLVSTDDAEIAAVAAEFGAPVPFLRPARLSDDDTRNTDVLIHAAEYMEAVRGFQYDLVLLLQPTCPIRKNGDVDRAIEMLWSSEFPTLASVRGPYKKRDKILKRITSGSTLVDYCEEDREKQEVTPFYIYNACIYGIKRSHLFLNKTFVSNDQVALVMSDLYSVDIDNELDLIKAEAYFNFLHNKESRE